MTRRAALALALAIAAAPARAVGQVPDDWPFIERVDVHRVLLDVRVTDGAGNPVEQLAKEQITGGCGGGHYCPLNPNTRGQMAVFVTKTFSLD